MVQMFHVIWHDIILHIPPCIPLVLTRCSRSGAKDCNSKAMASRENNSRSLKTARLLGPLDRDMSDKTSCSSYWSRVETEILKRANSQVLALMQQLKSSILHLQASY